MESKEIRALSLDVHATFQFWMCMQPADVDSSFNSVYACNLPILDVHATYQHDKSKSNPTQHLLLVFYGKIYSFFFLDFEN